MAFYGYNGDLDMYNSTPYSFTSDYDFASTPIHTSSQYFSPYEFEKPERIEYNLSAYYSDNSFIPPSELNQSVHTFSEPGILQCEPIEYRSLDNYYSYSANPSAVNFYSEPKLARVYVPSETKFTISYSTVEFNEPDYEEYDPTPYGGGYDAAKTYGKPIPPSDITCYPRSVPKPDSTSLENFSYSSIPSPYGKDDDPPVKAPSGSKPADTKVEKVEDGDRVTGDDIVEKGDKATSDGPDVEIGDERENDFENGTRGDYGNYEMPQIPYGSGLEAMDICESLFGYWPCLAKRAQQERNKCCCRFRDQESTDPWRSAADYLFGSPLVNDYENYHRHQQHQAQYECCYENSLLR